MLQADRIEMGRNEFSMTFKVMQCMTILLHLQVFKELLLNKQIGYIGALGGTTVGGITNILVTMVSTT